MNSTDLSAKLSEKEDIPEKDAKRIVNLLFETMKEAFEKGERIEIRGFGSFEIRNYGTYKGRNPKTGQTVDVPSKWAPFFKVGPSESEQEN